MSLEVYFHWHSFVEIVSEKWSILIDPFVEGNSLCDISLHDLYKKKILCIINTHGHDDHIWNTVEIAKKTDTLVVSTFELAWYHMKVNWLKNVHAMHIWWEHKFEDFSIKFVTAVHGWSISSIHNLPWTPAWVIVRLNWKNIYHAWDTWLTMDMKLLGDYDNIDVAFLPVWDNFTMWVKDAVIATSFIKPKIVVPMHYNTWPIINADVQEFARLIMLDNLATQKILSPGQCVVLDQD